MVERVLVTGGCGFVGSHLVRRLVEDFKVVVIDDLSNGVRENIADVESEMRLIVGDLRDAETVRESLRECRYVFHLAAQVSVERAIADPVTDAAINILGTLNVLRAAKHCERVVVFSSGAVYGEPIRMPIDEEHPRNPVSMYGVSKMASESYAYAFYRTFGLPVTILRPFNIYGPGQRRGNQYSGVIGIFAERVMNGENPIIYGDGTQTRDFVHVSDVVEAGVLAAESEKATGQIFNVATGKPTTINELAEKMIRISGKNLKPVHTKPRIGEIMHSIADISKIQKTLGYEPKITLTQGLKKLLE
ncbi:MAG: GDP-mannose 4,6-dehydratase [Candidatus Lokiarchaeia archaeon]